MSTTVEPANDRAASERRAALPSLTSVRCFAAVMVFLHHLHVKGNPLLIAPLELGYVGVSLFFILSGFVLTWSNKAGRTNREFYLRRFARVYPTHAVVVIATFTIAAAVGHTFGMIDFGANLALIHAWWTDPTIGFGINPVSWSLACEAVFYALFPLAFVMFSRVTLSTMWITVGAAYAAYLTAVLVVATQAQSVALSQATYTNPIVRLPEFLVGIALAQTIINRGKIPYWAAPLAVGIAGAGAAISIVWPAPDAWLAPTCAALIAFLAQRDIAGKTGPMGWSWLQYAGRVSYAFYLVHLQLLRIVWSFIGHTAVAAVAAFLLACLAAVALHHLIEVPVNRWILTGVRRSTSATTSDKTSTIEA